MNNLLRYNININTALLLVSIGLISPMVRAEVVKDPTKPLVNRQGGPLTAAIKKEEKKTGSLILQSVIVKNGRNFAVINGQVVKVGQFIEGYEVNEIVPYGAQLSIEGKDGVESLSLTLHKAKIKINNE